MKTICKSMRLGLLVLAVLALTASCAPSDAQEDAWPAFFSAFPVFNSQAVCQVELEGDTMIRTYSGLEMPEVEHYFDQLEAVNGFIVSGKSAILGDAENKRIYMVDFAMRSRDEQRFTYTIESFADQPGVPSLVIVFYDAIAHRAYLETIRDSPNVMFSPGFSFDKPDRGYSHKLVATAAEDGLVYEYFDVNQFVSPPEDPDEFEAEIKSNFPGMEYRLDADTVYMRRALSKPMTFAAFKEKMIKEYRDPTVEVVYDLEQSNPYLTIPSTPSAP